jgi:hypothetical protein
VLSTEAHVSIAENARSPSKNIRRCIAPAVKASQDQPALSIEITALTCPGEMVATVVLMQHPRARQPQIPPCDDLTFKVPHDVLWLNPDLADRVKDPKQAFVDRLLSPVHEGNRAPE